MAFLLIPTIPWRTSHDVTERSQEKSGCVCVCVGEKPEASMFHFVVHLVKNKSFKQCS